MKRGDVAIMVVIAAVTAASWSVSIARDDGRITSNSFTAGSEWAQRTEAAPVDCDLEVLGRTGPELDTLAWRRGCVAEAETTAAPPPPPPPAAPPPAPPAPGTPRPGLPAPR